MSYRLIDPIRSVLRMFFVLMVVGGAGLSAPAAEPVRRLSLEDCIQIGLERSATMANARRDLAIAGTQVTQARSQALPHLGVNASYTRLDELQSIDMGAGQAPAEMGTLDNYSVTAQASQTLYSGGKVGAALKAARLSGAYADFGLADSRAALIRDIRVSVYGILLARSAVAVREESLRQTQSLLTDTEQKFKAGTAAEFDVIRAQVRLANEKPEWIAARNGLLLSLEALRRLANLGEEPFELIGELKAEPVSLELEGLIRQALVTRPAFRQMAVAVRLKEQDVEATKSGYQPEINAFFNYNGANSYGYVSYSDNLEWHWSAGLAARWNLWDSGLTYGMVKEKRLQYEKMRVSLDDLEQAIRLEVKAGYLELQRAQETIEAARGNVALARRALEIARTRFDSGMATYLEFTDAQYALKVADLTFLGATKDQMTALAQLRYAVGEETGPLALETPHE